MRHLLIRGLPVSFLIFIVVLPTIRLLWEGQHGWSWELLSDPFVQWRFTWSFCQATFTCLIALLLGVPVAWVLARHEFMGRSLIVRLLLLPFVIPTIVAGMGVLALFGPSGLVWQSTEETPWLLLYGNLFYNLPLIIRAGLDGFTRVPANHIAIARSLGASPWRTFWRIECAQAYPWLTSAVCLVFLYCFAGFGLALLLGGQRYATLEVEIYTLVAHQLNLSEAGVLAILTMSGSGLMVWAHLTLERRQERPLSGQPLARRPPQNLRDTLMLAGALLILGIFAAAPLIAIVWRALTAGFAAWKIGLNSETLTAVGNTLFFTLLTVLGAAVMGWLHALGARHQPGLRILTFLPTIVSPICIAFGLLLLYPGLAAHAGLLIAAYVLFAYPFVANSLAASLGSQSPNLFYAARTLGATPLRAFFRVTWPLAHSSFRRGLAFAAATAIGEFAVTLFLSRPEWATLTTLTYHHLGRAGAHHLAAAWVLSSGLMCLALCVFIIIEWPDLRKKHA